MGTRASPLALVQTRAFLGMMSRFCPVHGGAAAFEELAIRTTGDASQASGVRLADIGGKGLFAKEIHEALLDGRIDLAVHSLKDLETELPPGIVLACTLKPGGSARRADPGACVRDVGRGGPRLPVAAAGALIGTSSVRRQAQLLRGDLRTAVIRGNVQSRLDKVRRGEFAASLLALAGLRRLGFEHEADVVIDPELMVPAACQGIVGITVREGDASVRRMLAAVSDRDADCAAAAERALLGALDGSCHTPIGAHADSLPDGRMLLTGLVARADGSFLLKHSVECGRADAARAGAALGAELRAASPRDMFGLERLHPGWIALAVSWVALAIPRVALSIPADRDAHFSSVAVRKARTSARAASVACGLWPTWAPTATHFARLHRRARRWPRRARCRRGPSSGGSCGCSAPWARRTGWAWWGRRSHAGCRRIQSSRYRRPPLSGAVLRARQAAGLT